MPVTENPRRGMIIDWIFRDNPRLRVAALTLYYLAIIAGLVVLYGRGGILGALDGLRARLAGKRA